jgi:integrase
MASAIGDQEIFDTLDTIKNKMSTKDDVKDIKDKLSVEELSIVIGRALKAAEMEQQRVMGERNKALMGEFRARPFIAEFLKQYEVKPGSTKALKGTNTYKQRRSMISTFSPNFIGDKNLLDVTEDDVSEFYDYLLDEDYATSSIDSIRKTLKLLYEYIMEQQKIGHYPDVVKKNLFERIVIQPERVARQGLTDEQVIRFIDTGNYTGGTYADMAFIAEMLVGTGMRPGELLRVEIQDINTKDRVIDVHLTKTDNPRTVVYPSVLHGKLMRQINGKSKSDKLIEYKLGLIDKYFTVLGQAAKIEIRSKTKKERVLNAATGQMEEVFKLDNVTPHRLRHSFISNLLNNGVNAAWVAKQVGHQTGSQTTTTYFDLDLQKLQQELDKYTPLNKVKELRL